MVWTWIQGLNLNFLLFHERSISEKDFFSISLTEPLQGKSLAFAGLLSASWKLPKQNRAFRITPKLVDAVEEHDDAIYGKEETRKMA